MKAHLRRVTALLAGAALAVGVSTSAQESANPAAGEETATNAVLRTAAIFVKDWDASVRFYTRHLGYEEAGEGAIDSAKSRATLGIEDGASARIMYLRPVNTRIARRWAGNGLALIEVLPTNGELPSLDRPDPGSVRAVAGEIALVHEVVEIRRIYAAMQADDAVTIVVPLGPSATGKSLSFSALDPNGIRVEIYQYVEAHATPQANTE